MKLLETQWINYRNAVTPRLASEVQLLETRRAFFAGAWALYALMMTNLEEGPNETPKDIALLEKLDREMREFKERVQKGHA